MCIRDRYQIKQKYGKALFTGAVDPDEYLQTMLSEMEAAGAAAVSYTHLDVYKRQRIG